MPMSNAELLLSKLTPEGLDLLPFSPYVPMRRSKLLGTCRKWFTENDGKVVWTLQAGVSDKGVLHSAWSPGSRVVDASRSSYVRLDGSVRDYAGLRVIGSDNQILVAECDWGSGTQTVVYLLDNRATPVIG